jgi:glycosyltransferase involved in cell wall biosynthesis
MPDTPKVATLIATHNYGHYLVDAINSALNQTYPNEVWVVDDASTDDTEQLMYCHESNPFTAVHRSDEIEACSYAIVDGKKIFYLKLKVNGGPSRARNIGIVNAMQGGAQFIQVLDADDIMKPTKIEELIKPILADPQSVGATYADYTIWTLPDDTKQYEAKSSYSWNRLMAECIVHSGSLINCLALQKVALGVEGKPYPIFYLEELRTCEDYNLWMRIAKSMIFVHVPKNLTIVRNQPNNSTLTVDRQTWARNYQYAKQQALSS